MRESSIAHTLTNHEKLIQVCAYLMICIKNSLSWAEIRFAFGTNLLHSCSLSPPILNHPTINTVWHSQSCARTWKISMFVHRKMHFLFVRRIILRQILEAATDDYTIVGISNDPFGILRIVVMKFEQLIAFLKFSDTELRPRG